MSADRKQMPLIPEKPPVYRCEVRHVDDRLFSLTLDCEPWAEAGCFVMDVREEGRVTRYWVPLTRIISARAWTEEVGE